MIFLFSTTFHYQTNNHKHNPPLCLKVSLCWIGTCLNIAQLTNYIPFDVGIGTCLNVVVTSQLVPTPHTTLAEFGFAQIPPRNKWAAPQIGWIFTSLRHTYSTCSTQLRPSHANSLPFWAPRPWLNGTRGLHIHQRLKISRQICQQLKVSWWGSLCWYCWLRATAPTKY
jgi:hypothetical protein